MRTLVFLLVLATLGFAAAGCFLQDHIFGRRGHFLRGRVTFGFEESGFRPCNTDEQWWIVGSDDTIIEFQERWGELGLDWYQHAYAEIRGSRSDRGEYGHLGAYQREIDVREILEVRLLEEGECPWPVE
jgi:hypothetical protein